MFEQNPKVRSAAEIAVEFRTAVPDERFRSYLKANHGIVDIAGMIAFSGSFSLPSASIENFTGIEYAVNATGIFAYSNPFTLMPIASMVNASSVIIYATNITKFNAAHLASLTNLNLASGNMAQADVEQTIEDLWVNRAALGALSCSITFAGNPGSAGAAASKASEISDLIAAGCSVSM